MFIYYIRVLYSTSIALTLAERNELQGWQLVKIKYIQCLCSLVSIPLAEHNPHSMFHSHTDHYDKE